MLLVSPKTINAEESATFKKIGDVSPDGKFAVRIACSSEPQDPNNIDSALMTAVELVSLPLKVTVTKLIENGGDYSGGVPKVIWSPDLKWLAFALADGPRVTYTHVYRRSGDDFTPVDTDDLRVDAKGDVRNEYVKPIRWTKPAVLLLEQFDIFRGGEGEDATYRFTAKFDEKSGKFQVTSKKKVPSKE